MNLATAGRGLLHEGLAAGLVSADAASMLKALEIFGATPTILDVCILSVWFRTAIRRSGLSGAGPAFDRSERPADEVCQSRESEDHPFAVPRGSRGRRDTRPKVPDAASWSSGSSAWRSAATR